MLNREEVRADVRKVIADVLDDEPGGIDLGFDLEMDLGVDSLDRANIILALEAIYPNVDFERFYDRLLTGESVVDSICGAETLAA